MDAQVDIVGLGLGVNQTTQAGLEALAGCRWLGYYGLPASVRIGFVSLWPTATDLDAALNAVQPQGFVARLAESLRQAAARFGRVGLAVNGHPVAANPSTGWLRAALQATGVRVAIHGAPGALDHFMAATGIDLVERCISLVDAPRWLAQHDDNAGRALAIWNAGYLAGPQSALLVARLRSRFAPAHPVRLFRVVGAEPCLEAWPLLPAEHWLARLDAETTLFVF